MYVVLRFRVGHTCDSDFKNFDGTKLSWSLLIGGGRPTEMSVWRK